MGNRRLYTLSILICLFLPGTYSHAQSTATWIEFGKVRLTLGLPQDVVLGKLAQDYRIDRADEGLYLVTTKDEPHRTVGTIRFKEGKLPSIFRNWAEYDQQGAELARSLYRLVQTFVQEGRTACTINVVESEQAEGEDRSVIMKCGPKSIDVHITRLQNVPEVATIEESLESE